MFTGHVTSRAGAGTYVGSGYPHTGRIKIGNSKESSLWSNNILNDLCVQSASALHTSILLMPFILVISDF